MNESLRWTPTQTCQCPTRARIGDAHGCVRIPTRCVSMGGRLFWLCRDCQDGADEYIGQLAVRGLPRGHAYLALREARHR
jgi:hypothetical protein